MSSRKDIIKRVSAASGVSLEEVEKTLDATITVVTDMIGSKGSGLEKGMKALNIYQSFVKK